MRFKVPEMVTSSVVPRLTFMGISSNKSGFLAVYHASGGGWGGHKMSDDLPFRKTAFVLGIRTAYMRFTFLKK